MCLESRACKLNFHQSEQHNIVFIQQKSKNFTIGGFVQKWTLRSYFDFQAERSFQEVNQTTSNFRKCHHFAASAEFNFFKEEIPDLIKQTEI
jgi:alpha-D-ribose 1-methylphosphonate 5-triphosphate synthase subunit PhnI